MIWLAAAFVLSLVLASVFGLAVIPFLRRVKAGQSILEIGPKWHKTKQGTPTMGGVIFIASTALSMLAFDLSGLGGGDFSGLFVLLFAAAFGLIGFIDDYFKVVRKRNLGLTAFQKLVLQLSVAAAFLALMRYFGMTTPNVFIPFFNVTVPVLWMLYLFCALIYVVGFVNAVNLTDGIDGLVSGVTIPVALFFAFLSLAVTGGLSSLTGVPVSYGIFSAALAGGLTGFLIYNFNPAKVFMGDTGSLFLGGALCGLAFACDMPLILIPVGLIYLIEMFSVILQVVWFKASGGKRLFKMAPIHHHCEMSGWKEKKIFTVFVSATVVFCVITFLSVCQKYRI